jgi:hypothetical protein
VTFAGGEFEVFLKLVHHSATVQNIYCWFKLTIHNNIEERKKSGSGDQTGRSAFGSKG